MTLAQRCRLINALILDVDGVLTHGDIVYGEQAGEIKLFHVRDGSAINIWIQRNKKIGILSGRQSQVTLKRAQELGIEHVVQGQSDKVPGFHRLMEQWNTDKSAVAYVGDDIPDVAIMKQVGLAIAPADACIEARISAHAVTRQPGGQGAVREAIEMILQSQSQWPVMLHEGSVA